MKFLGGYDSLTARLDEIPVDEVVVALEADEIELLPHVFAACDKNGVRITMVPFYSDYLPARPTIDVLDECKLINVRQTPFDNLLNAAVKRGLDIIGSLILIILTSPIMLATAIGVKLSSPGPIIFKQERVGLNKRPFMMYKFRSMTDQRDENGELLPDEVRLTKFGRALRSTSLDELPELWNIFKGDMSIVGNRPLPLYEAELLTTDEYIERFMAPSGLTGLWQVEKRGDQGALSAEERKQLDIKYARNFSFGNDIKIICKTFTAFVQKENV